MSRFDDATVAFFFSYLMQHWGGLNFCRIFSKFLSEVLKCREISGIAFVAYPLIFTVSGMMSSFRHFEFSSKEVKINVLDLLSTNLVLFFKRRTSSVLPQFCFFIKLVKKQN